jgi:NTE family protein
MGTAVGVVLAGGGARGFAHIGAIKAMRAAHIPIDLVGGTSMGSIVAAGVALEWDDQELRERMHAAFVRSDPLADFTFPLVALAKGRMVERRLLHHFGEARAEDLWRPYFAVASNLTSGDAVVLRRGLIREAVRASIAIPGILPPVVSNGNLLVDGGVMNNLPCDVMDAMRRGPVIGIDVARRQQPEKPHHRGIIRRSFAPPNYDGPGIVNLLLRSATVGSAIQTRSTRDHADLILDPPLDDVEIADWHSFDRAIERGYQSAMARMDDLLAFAADRE